MIPFSDCAQLICGVLLLTSSIIKGIPVDFYYYYNTKYIIYNNVDQNNSNLALK